METRKEEPISDRTFAGIKHTKLSDQLQLHAGLTFANALAKLRKNARNHNGTMAGF